MSILIDENTRLLVQGITGGEGSFYTQSCLEYGSKIVSGVTPGKGGGLWEGKVPIFNSVREAVEKTGANASLIFVPAAFASDAIFESVDASLSPIICITEFIPTFDMIEARQCLQKKGIRLIGPNCPGVISPGKCKAGIMVGGAFMPGKVGVCSRSGTLTYEVAAMLTEVGIGQSTCAGLGGDPVPGTTFAEILKLFEEDSETEAIVLIGEIGGTFEQDAAEVIKKMKKPVVAFVAGSSAPPGRRMGHAGAIITGSAGRADEKKKALAAAGAIIAEVPPEIPAKVRQVLK